MASERKQTSVRRRLTRTMMYLVLGTVLTLAVSGWFLLVSPSVDSIALARIGQLSALVQAQLHRLASVTDRQLKITASWLTSEGVSLDHSTLNRRYMPILAQYPEYSSILIADTGGSEWLLLRKPDGGWMNRLTSPDDKDGKHRFLHWTHSGTLERDERQKSDYNPLERPWFRGSMRSPPGQTTWTEIYRFFTLQEPGVTAAMRLPAAGDSELVIGLDLRLIDIARKLNSVRLGNSGQAMLLSAEGRILGLTNFTGNPDQPVPEELIFKPVTELKLEPLRKGLDSWLDRGEQPLEDSLLWHGNEVWHVGFRKLDLGDEGLWLGVYLPISELIPGIYLQLSLLAGVLLLAIGAVLSLALRTARGFSEPLERLAANSRRIGDLDFATPRPVDSDILEVDQLARAQDEMRALLAGAHDDLVHKNQALQEAQGQLIQAAKLESVGRLAAGVAHEVKNPLAIVQMGVDFIRGESGISETVSEVLTDMDDAVTRADGVVKGLLDFSREKRLDLVNGDMNQVIRSSLHLVEHELKQRNITWELHLQEDLPHIPLDADKLRQVFINLAMNAAQAMGKDGTLSISSGLREFTTHSGLEQRDSRGLFNPGEEVLWVEVADTGPGLDEDALERIFDPFFTTKAVGEGTGLGLSVTRTIVNLHQGCIEIRNRAEGGASAMLLFKLPDGAIVDEEDPGSR